MTMTSSMGGADAWAVQEPGYRPAPVLTGWAVGLLASVGAFNVLLGVLDLVTALSYPAFLADPENAPAGELALGLGLFCGGVLTMGLFIACAVVFCCWVYRANSNARALGSEGMQFTPGWSVGWFFIPIMCLFKPFQVMQEIWKASTRDANSQDWREIRATSLLSWWWAAWLIGNVVSQVELRLSWADDPSLNQAGLWVGVASSALGATSAALAIAVVRSIYQRQQMKASTVGVPQDLVAPSAGPQTFAPTTEPWNR